MDKIKDLPWIDKYAGVVKIISKKNESGKPSYFPVSCQLTSEECNTSKYMDLCPDSSKRSVTYLEDKGVRPTGVNAWKASFDLVCWLNFKQLGFVGCSYTGIAIAGILSTIDINPFNVSVFKNISIELTGQQSVNTNPFQKYSYDEAVNQFMLHPYEFFVVTMDVDFEIDPRCVTIPDAGEVDACAST